MRRNLFRAASFLTGIVIMLMMIQAVGGLLMPDIYRDNLFVKSAWFGNDLVNLFLAVPILLASWLLTLRGSLRARLIWLGMLAFAVYNYAFYVFGSALNGFFLIFVALFTFATYALIFGLASLDIRQMLPLFTHTIPARRISGYMFIWGILLSVIWIGQSVKFAYTSQLPQIVIATDSATNVTAILDLWLMVPAVFLSALLLWHRQSWGFVLGTIMNVKASLYALVLAVGSYIGYSKGIPGLAEQIPLWLFLCLASLVCCLLLLGESKKAVAEQELDFPVP